MELIAASVKDPNHDAVHKTVNKVELAKHCRRCTKGAEVTIKNIEALLLSLTGSTDTLGVPLFSDDMLQIWREQKTHVQCIQDFQDVSLYSQIGEVTKGG